MSDESIGPDTPVMIEPEALDAMVFFICTGLTLAAKHRQAGNESRALQQLQVIAGCMAAYSKLIPIIVSDGTITWSEMSFVKEAFERVNGILETFENDKPDPSSVH
jgi:hypothetical protein